MPEARLEVEIPADVWIGELSRRYPETTLEVLAALPREANGVGLTEVEGPSPTALIEEMSEYDDVQDVEVLKELDESTLIQFETSLPLLLLPARDAGVPLETPFELRDGTVVWELTAPSEALSELFSQLDYFEVSYSICYIHHGIEHKQLLTNAQQKLVEQAIDMGYYDTPRRCSLTDLAEATDRSKSTASEMLHRAESKVMKRYAGAETPTQH